MKEGPDIAFLGAMIGDPARASMLNALLSGKALTASELATEAGVTPQTASSHLAKLQESGFVIRIKQGRHRYFSLADERILAAHNVIIVKLYIFPDTDGLLKDMAEMRGHDASAGNVTVS